MIITDQERSDYFFRKEQQTRFDIVARRNQLFERARRQVDLRITHYPRNMQPNYQAYVETLHDDMCREDLQLGILIGQQQHYLRLAHAYKARTT